MPDSTTIHDDLYLAEEAMIGLLKQVLPDANYVRESDRHSSTPPERISVKAEVKDIPGADIFEIDYSILVIAPGDTATPTDATRRATVRAITNYLRTLHGGRSLYFADLRCALHSPTLGRPEESTCRDATEDKNNMDEIVLTCGGQRNVSEVEFMKSCGFTTVEKGTVSGTSLSLISDWIEADDFSIRFAFDPDTDLISVSGEFNITLPENSVAPPAEPQTIVIEITVLAGYAPGACRIIFLGEDGGAYPTGFEPLVLSPGGEVAASTYTYRLTRSNESSQYTQIWPEPVA